MSETLYLNIEAQISILAKKPSFANLNDILPECIKNEGDVSFLLQKLQFEVRLMPDGIHICSNQYLNKCLGWFKNVSESEASKLIR